MKDMIMHYELYDEDEAMRRANGLNASFMHSQYIQARRVQAPQAPIPEIHSTDGYDITLVPGELSAKIIQEGYGPCVRVGQYIKVAEHMYYEGENYDLKKGEQSYIYGRNKIPIGLEMFFGLAKAGMQAIVQFGPTYSQSMNFSTSKKSRLVTIKIIVLSISNWPNSAKLRDLIVFHQETFELSQEADLALSQNDLETCLKLYEIATERLNSPYFMDTVSNLKRENIQKNRTVRKKKNRKMIVIFGMDEVSEEEEVILPDEDEQKKAEKKEKFENEKKVLSSIRYYSDNIAMKAIEAAFLAKEYFKTIKWAGRFLMNPHSDKNDRVLLTRARTYIEIQEFERAEEDLKYIRMVDPQNKYLEEEMKLLEKRKAEYRERLAQQPVLNSVEPIIKTKPEEQKLKERPMKPAKKKKNHNQNHNFFYDPQF